MPIRINLLAEQQAAEEMRRRDPVKRSIWVGGALVAAVLIWVISLYLQVRTVRNEVAQYEGRWQALEKNHTQVTKDLDLQRKIENDLAALQRLATNRFLWATPLNALQQTIIPNIKVTRIKAEQTFVQIEETRIGKAVSPPSSVERIKLTIDAHDYAPPTENNHAKYKESIAAFPYFQENLMTNGVVMLNLSAPQPDPAAPTRTFMFLTLECRYPERVRQ